MFDKYRQRRAERAVNEAEEFVKSASDEYYRILNTDGPEAADKYFASIDPMVKAVMERARRRSTGR